MLLVCLAPPALALAKAPVDFEATLELHRNGKLMGESKVGMSSEGEQWSMHSRTRGTRGLAKFVGLDENSTSNGDWVNGAARTLAFERNVRAIKKMHWNAEFDWEAGVAEAAEASSLPVQSGEPLYILYTSGTTGMPKGVVRDNGGHAVALKWSLENVYAMQPGDVFWAASGTIGM